MPTFSLGEAFVDIRANLNTLDKDLALVSQRISKGLTRAGSGLKSAGTSLVAGLTVPLAGIGIAAGKAAADFDDAMKQIIGLAGKPPELVKEFEDDLLRLSVVVGKAPKEMADALFFLASAGLTTSQILDTLDASAKASAAGLGETQVIARLASSALNAYRGSNLSAAQAVSVIVAAVREGNAEADEMAESLGRTIAVAAELGVSFDQVAGAVAAMTRVGLDAAESTTALRSVLNTILNPSAQADQMLEQLGLSAQGLREELREKGLIAVLGTLREATMGNGDALATIVPNVRALTGVLSLAGENIDSTRQVMAAMAATTQDDLKRAFEATEGPARQFGRLMAILKISLIQLGNVILPVVIPIFERIAVFVRNVAEAFTKLSPKTQRFIILGAMIATVLGPVLIALGLFVTGLGLLVGAFGPVFTVLGTFVRLLIAGVGGAIRVMGPAILGLGRVILKGVGIALRGVVTAFTALPAAISVPIALALAAVVLFPETLKKIFSLETLKAIFDVVRVALQNFLVNPILEAVNSLVEKANVALEFFGAPLIDFKFDIVEAKVEKETGDFLGGIAETFTVEAAKAKERIGGAVAGVTGFIGDSFSAGLGLAEEKINGALASFQNVLAAPGEMLKKFMAMFEGELIPKGEGVLEPIVVNSEEIMQKLKDFFARMRGEAGATKVDMEELGQSISFSMEQNLTDAVTQFQSFGDAARNIIQMILSELIRLAIIKPLVGGVLKAFGLPGFAMGGRMEAGQAAVVGERGREVFVPSVSGTMIPNHRISIGEEGAGMAGGIQQNFNFPLAFPPQLEAFVRNIAGPAGREAAIGVLSGMQGRI